MGKIMVKEDDVTNRPRLASDVRPLPGNLVALYECHGRASQPGTAERELAEGQADSLVYSLKRLAAMGRSHPDFQEVLERTRGDVEQCDLGLLEAAEAYGVDSIPSWLCGLLWPVTTSALHVLAILQGRKKPTAYEDSRWRASELERLIAEHEITSVEVARVCGQRRLPPWLLGRFWPSL